MSNKLFDASDESDSDLKLGTNKDYAKSYNNFRKKELLKKFKDRGYNAPESSSSDESSESSEEDEVLDPKFDQEFFKTLASLKSKDPSIYDKSTRFFINLEEEENEERKSNGDIETAAQKVKKAKPVTLKDYERQVILERGGKFEDDSDVEVSTENGRSASPTVVEEEKRLKAEFREVLEANDSEEEEFGGIFKRRQKTKAEQEKEDEDFAEWLVGKQTDIEDQMKQKLEPLKKYWENKKLPQSEKFLRDYILNKGYAETKTSEIPTYNEIVGEQLPLSEDEQELEKQADFEHKYNFRFEEPDAEFVKRYPRTIESSVRRTDGKRKQKREEQKERKQQEKEQKMKELELVKEMKRKEIEEKIRKIKMVTGNEELAFKDEELEEDFDPDAHDRRMQEIFNEEYYQVDEGEEKPDCPSDIEELKMEDWDNYNPRQGGGADENGAYEPHCEDEDFNMDCDYDPVEAKQQLQNELIENTKSRRGRKGRRNRFMEMIQTEKPVFNPEDEKTYAEYIDEYYKIDCEDIIGDTPCRFKYVETTPNDFGLTIEEILLAKNKELNQWASLKKAIQIRPEHIEKKDQRLYKMKAQNEDLKRKIFKSLYGEGSDEEDDHERNANENGDRIIEQKEEKKNETVPHTSATVTSSESKTGKKRKRKSQVTTSQRESNEEKEAKKLKLEENVSEQKNSIKIAENRKDADNTNESVAKKKRRRKNKNKNETVSHSGETTINQKGSSVVNQTPKFANLQLKQGKSNMQTNSTTAEPKSRNFKGSLSDNNATSKNSNNPFKAQSKFNSGNLNIKFKAKTYSSKAAGCTKFENKFKNDRKTKKDDAANGNANITDERLKAYGINPRKYHKKQKYGRK